MSKNSVLYKKKVLNASGSTDKNKNKGGFCNLFY